MTTGWPHSDPERCLAARVLRYAKEDASAEPPRPAGARAGEHSALMARLGLSPARSSRSPGALEEAPGSDGGAGSPRRKTIFAICAMGLFMASIDATIVATALRKIDSELHAPVNWGSWSITIYQFGQILAMPLAGKISDQFGRKKVFLISVGVFTAASLACGLSTSIYMLVPLRFIQALGGGAFLPSASGIVSDHFGKDRDRALGLFTSIFPIGGIAGPVFGGLITQYWDWRVIFFINIPVGIVLIALGVHFIPSTRPAGARAIDKVGVALLAGTLLTGMYGITNLGDHGSSLLSPDFVVAELLAVTFGFLFLRHSRRDNAFIPHRLLVGKGFGTMNLINILYGTTALGFGALVPLYAENRYGISIAHAGTLLSARAIGMISIAAVAAFMLRRTGYHLPMICGFSAIAIGLVMLAIHPPAGFPAYWWLAGWSMLTGLGMGVSAPATNNATLQLAPDQVAAIAGQRGMFRQSGGIIYISIATAILARGSTPEMQAMIQAHIFLIQAAILVVMMSMVFRVPDHKGSW